MFEEDDEFVGMVVDTDCDGVCALPRGSMKAMKVGLDAELAKVPRGQHPWRRRLHAERCSEKREGK